MDIKAATSAYNAIANIAQNNPAEQVASTDSASFAELVSNALESSAASGKKAEQISSLAVMGKADIGELATAVSQAELALNTVVTIRDKVISAYQQIMQMSI